MGLPWPAGFPPTRQTTVLADVAAAPADARSAFERFLGAKGITGTQASHYLGAWLNAAWNALVLAGVGDRPGVYQRLEAERATINWDTVALSLMPVLAATAWAMNEGSGSPTETLDKFFKRWKDVLDDFRHKWDVRDPAKRALRARLAMIGDQPIDEDTRMEVQRFVTWANYLARGIQASIEEQRTQLRSLIQAREFDLDDNLRLSAELIGAALAAVIAATMHAAWSVIAGTVHGLGFTVHGLGLGMTFALIGVGVLVLGWFALPVIAPMIGASRALRRAA